MDYGIFVHVYFNLFTSVDACICRIFFHAYILLSPRKPNIAVASIAFNKGNSL